eukprot:CAMPEP_0184024980 /NCGR_PEP_ID=MMETSP0954-20121128/12484_1 /TAXON_ID=627963 /ORGANISM="Aplanochytrium sp, Strain PBS07" /LENGTH=356 /DNA_ID=CAMNT_0026308569 /DNA_START=19 /DNA_END=1089 /DNA_ORIENTATION=+
MSLKREREQGKTAIPTSLRRKIELKELHEENQKLKQERAQFLEKIQELNCALNQRLPESAEERKAKTENDELQLELKNNEKFMVEFGQLVRSTPTAEDAENKVLRELSDVAYDLVSGLLAQSQVSWTPLSPPAGLGLCVKDCCLCYRFEKEKTGNDGRLNIRLDCKIPNATLSSVSSVLWSWFCRYQAMINVGHVDDSQAELKSVKENEDEIKVVSFKRKLKDIPKEQEIVFVCNRRKAVLSKSTLVPPAQKTLGAQGVGKVNATVLSAMTTPLPCNMTPVASLNNSKVVKGGIVWQEPDFAQMIVVYSVPDCFRFDMEDTSAPKIITKTGRMTKGLAKVLQNVTELFTSIVKDSS